MEAKEAMMTESRPVRARYLGLQERLGGPPVPLYRLLEDVPGHPADSTVSGPTLRELGYSLPGLPCTGDPLRGCPHPGVWLLFWPSGPGVAPDSQVLCDGCLADVKPALGPHPSRMGPVVVPIEVALHPVGNVA
jgi:hypothetical protein